MGKVNDKMRKSRASILNRQSSISPDVFDDSDESMERTKSLIQAAKNMGYFNDPSTIEFDLSEHRHVWHFALQYAENPMISKFACLCGAVKRVKQFEVED